MSGEGYFRGLNAFGVIGSTFGLIGPLLSLYVLSLGENAAVITIIIEAMMWAAWFAFQALGMYEIYKQKRELSQLFAVILGFISAILEIVLVIWVLTAMGITDPSDAFYALFQLLVLGILGMGSTLLYLVFLAAVMFKSTDNELAKFAGILYLVSAVLLFFYFEYGIGAVLLSNLLTAFIFAGYGSSKLQYVPQRIPDAGIGLDGSHPIVEEQGPRFCPYCGRPMTVADGVFCPFCGKKIR